MQGTGFQSNTKNQRRKEWLKELVKEAGGSQEMQRVVDPIKSLDFSLSVKENQ